MRTIDLAPNIARRLRDSLTRASLFAETAAPDLNEDGRRTAADLKAEADGWVELLEALLRPTRGLAPAPLPGTVPLESDGVSLLDVEVR